jgi:endonuclease YncB( thermonuclease family)
MRSLTLYRSTLICLLWVVATLPALAEQRLHGRPAQILGGNELLLIAEDGGHHRIRLMGTGIPQPQQRWGAAAGRHLRMLVMGKPVQFLYPPQHATGWLAGRLLHGGVDINRRLLAAGLVRFDPAPALSPQIADDYRSAERAARQKGLGIWRGNSEVPPAARQRLPGVRQHSERQSTVR